MAPLAPVITRENRQFLGRAVTWAASQGIGQFFDLGCGMPTAHEGFAGYSTAVAPVYNHSAVEFASFFDSLEILPPGVVDARMWCARTGEPDPLPRDQYAIVGVARI